MRNQRQSLQEFFDQSRDNSFYDGVLAVCEKIDELSAKSQSTTLISPALGLLSSYLEEYYRAEFNGDWGRASKAQKELDKLVSKYNPEGD